MLKAKPTEKSPKEFEGYGRSDTYNRKQTMGRRASIARSELSNSMAMSLETNEAHIIDIEG